MIAERLDTAETVAAAKFFSGAPVVDDAREAAVLEQAEALASAASIDLPYVREVFVDQMTASKDVQYALLDQWRSGSSPSPGSAPDLATEVRPTLDRVTPELVDALTALAPYRADIGCADAVTSAVARIEPRSYAAAGALDTALAHLCDRA